MIHQGHTSSVPPANILPKQKYEPVVAVVGWLFVWHGVQETAWQIPWPPGCLQGKLGCNHEPHKAIPLPSGKKQMWELKQKRKMKHKVCAHTLEILGKYLELLNLHSYGNSKKSKQTEQNLYPQDHF